MKKWSRKKRWLVGMVTSLGCLPLLWFGGAFAIGYFNLFHAHEHCSKGLGLALRIYSGDHEGNFPYHTNGFGDALLLLLKEDMVTDPRTLTAPGDDGRMFKECRSKGLDVDETKCSRIYIQGLSETKIGEYSVAIVFDAYPTPGGDHFRRPWGEPTRDVVMADGSVEFVYEKNWPRFATNQIERLAKLGLNRDELEKLFGIDIHGRRTK
jgi:hypothetical protein